MLKKAIALCLAAGCIFCVGLLPSLILGTAPKVRVVTPQVTEYLPTVRCSGTVRTESSYDLVSAGIYQVAETYGQAGDNVEEGEVLALLKSMDGEAFFVRQAQDAQADYSQQLAGLAGQYGMSAAQLESLAKAPEEAATQQVLAGQEETIQVRAPISGILTTDLPASGTAVTQGMVLCRVQSDSYLVTAKLGERDVDEVTVGDQVTITGEGLGGIVCRGVVEKIYPTAKQVLGSAAYETVVEADIRITDIPEKIKPGYSVKVNIFTDSEKQLVTLPYEAVGQDENNREYVYVTGSGGRLEKRLVTTGLELADGVEILEGIGPDEAVAVLGNVQEPEKKKIYLLKEE